MRWHPGSAHGTALVEMALTLPLLTIVLVGTIDFARVFYTGIQLTNAVRAGAQYGASSLGASADISGMQTVAENAVDISGLSIGASRLCQCATGDGQTFSSTSPTANNCTQPAATSCPTAGTHRIVTVTVTGSKTFSMAARSIFGLPSSVPLTRSATLRVSE